MNEYNRRYLADQLCARRAARARQRHSVRDLIGKYSPIFSALSSTTLIARRLRTKDSKPGRPRQIVGMDVVAVDVIVGLPAPVCPRANVQQAGDPLHDAGHAESSGAGPHAAHTGFGSDATFGTRTGRACAPAFIDVFTGAVTVDAGRAHVTRCAVRVGAAVRVSPQTWSRSLRYPWRVGGVARASANDGPRLAVPRRRWLPASAACGVIVAVIGRRRQHQHGCRATAECSPRGPDWSEIGSRRPLKCRFA